MEKRLKGSPLCYGKFHPRHGTCMCLLLCGSGAVRGILLTLEPLYAGFNVSCSGRVVKSEVLKHQSIFYATVGKCEEWNLERVCALPISTGGFDGISISIPNIQSFCITATKLVAANFFSPWTADETFVYKWIIVGLESKIIEKGERSFNSISLHLQALVLDDDVQQHKYLRKEVLISKRNPWMKKYAHKSLI